MKYKGFSSRNFLINRSFVITDKEVIKQDLQNRIFCSRVKGERIMMENYGTSIPDVPFEPLDDDTIGDIVEDIEFVFQRDPRVTLRNIVHSVDEEQNSITMNCEFEYVELSGYDQLELYINFNE